MNVITEFFNSLIPLMQATGDALGQATIFCFALFMGCATLLFTIYTIVSITKPILDYIRAGTKENPGSEQ